MADIASELANKCDISVESAQKGLGVLLGLLKSKLPADTFSKVSAAIPGAEGMMTKLADTPEQASGGVLSAVKGAVSKIFGGGTDALLANLGQLGISPDKIQPFIASVLETLKGKLPENVMTQISDMLPVPQEAAH